MARGVQTILNRKGDAWIPRWIIAAALHRELKGIHDVLEQRVTLPTSRGSVWSGYLEHVPVLLAWTGMGGRKACRVCRNLMERVTCKGIISIGYAGSLRQGIEIGDILVAQEIVVGTGPEAKPSKIDKDLLSLARRSIRGTSSNRVFIDRMITTDRVIASSQEKKMLGEQYSAAAVEMESGFLAELAREMGLPFLAIRTISDDVSTELPEYGRLREWKKEGNYREIFSYLATHPRELLGIVRMQRSGSIASHTLTRCVIEFFRNLS